MLVTLLPYFQNKPALPCRAVASVQSQNGAGIVRVVVGVNSSPVPAKTELVALLAARHGCIILLQQVTCGPAAASLGPEVQIVALFNSDDAWRVGCLQRRHRALDAGADFFLSDWQRPNGPWSCFANCGVSATRHRPMNGGRLRYRYDGGLFGALLKAAMVGTATISYRCSPMQEPYFKTASACGDILFWEQIPGRSMRIGFSEIWAVLSGVGSNIFRGASWGTLAHLERHLGHGYDHRDVQQMFLLSLVQIKRSGIFMGQIDDDLRARTWPTRCVESRVSCRRRRAKPAGALRPSGASRQHSSEWLLRKSSRQPMQERQCFASVCPSTNPGPRS